MEFLTMPSRAHLACFPLLGAAFLFACDDGRLDVLEPAHVDSGASGGAGGTAGGAAGSLSSGGTSATGGGSTAGSSSAGSSSLPSPFVLDDFEDGDTQSLNIPEGFWYSQPDSTCSAPFGIETVVGRADNTHAIRTRGGVCTDWGALLGLDLGGTIETFDASSFDALRFSLRVEAGTPTELNVSLHTPVHFDTVIDATTEWQEFVLPLDGFFFNDRPPEQAFDVSRLTHLQFFVFSPEPFDFWLDDIAFVRSE
jgi:hypothetical protein